MSHQTFVLQPSATIGAIMWCKELSSCCKSVFTRQYVINKLKLDNKITK